MKGSKKTDEHAEQKKTKHRISNIFYTIKPVLISEYIVGIFRFTYHEARLKPPNWPRKIYALCTIALYISIYASFLKLPVAINGNDNIVDVIDEVPCVVILIQYITSLIATNFFFTNENIKIINTFADLDNQIHKPNGGDYYQKTRSMYIKWLTIMGLTHIIISMTNIFTEDVVTVTAVISLPLYLIQRLEILVFCIIIEMLKSRLETINEYIAKFLHDNNDNGMSVFTVCVGEETLKQTLNMIGRPSATNKKIRNLATAYDTIGAMTVLVNDLFNFQIFMTLVSTFIYIIVTIWTSLFYYRTPENNSGPLISISIWCFSTLMTVAVMCFVCERLSLNRNTTKILVNEIIMDYSLPNTMRVQAKAFMEMIEAWPLHILIYDMFTVDISLMLKFISVSTTYLIVIIQISHFV